MDIEEKVKKFIEKQGLIRKDDRILLGLSGGADSVCLFYLLLTLRKSIGFSLRAAHVHHGIRPEAEKDVTYVTTLCKKEKVSCYIFREDVPAYADEQGLGEEEAGRSMRYQDFRKSLKAWQEEEVRKCAPGSQIGSCGEAGPPRFKIATAHHENDQAETVLFQLFRGCGLSGLRGILPERENIIRPLLCLSRKEIEAYLKEKGISWCEDKTNMREDYSRNKIRHRILPYVEDEICRGTVSHIGKTAEIVREAESYIRRQTQMAYRKIAEKKEDVLVFDRVLLMQEDIFLQKQILLYGLESVSAARKDIGAVHVEDMIKLMRKQGNGELHLPGGVRVLKLYEKLLIFPENGKKEQAMRSEFLPEKGGFLYGEEEPLAKTERIDLLEEEFIRKRFGIRDITEIMKCIPQKTYTKWFDYDKIETSFLFRHPESGDYLTIDKERNRKSLRRYMIDARIPVPGRDQIWLLADGAHVMWVPGGRMSMYYKVTEQTKTILQIKICMEE